MTEHLQRIKLGELLGTIRIRRRDGVVTEVSDAQALRSVIHDIGKQHPQSADKIEQFFRLAEDLVDPKSEYSIEFSISIDD